MTEANDLTQEIQINGKRMRVPAPLTVADLLDHLGIGRKHVAVEQNRRLVPKGEFETAGVTAGDEFEIVTFVGGG